MYNFKYLIGGAALVLATSALAGGPEVAPAPVVESGFYINVNGGLTLLANDNRDIWWNNNNVNVWLGRNNYETAGWNIAAELGYRYNQFRIGVEGAYMQHDRRNNNNDFIVLGLGNWGLRDLDIVTVLLNGYYDFDMGNNFVPYVGLGLGWGQVNSGFRIWNAAVPANNFRVNWDRDGFAFQGVLGVDYKVSDNVRVGLSYHAVGITNDNNNRGRWVNNFNFAWGHNDTIFENKINLGLSYFF